MHTYIHQTVTKMNQTRRKHSEGHDSTGREALIILGKEGSHHSRQGSSIPGAWEQQSLLGRAAQSPWGRSSQGPSSCLAVGVQWDAQVFPGEVRTADIPCDIVLTIRRIQWVCKMGPDLLKFFYTATNYEARNSLEYSLLSSRKYLPSGKHRFVGGAKRQSILSTVQTLKSVKVR